MFFTEKRASTVQEDDGSATPETRIYMDNKLTPQMVSSLLNINVLLKDGNTHRTTSEQRPDAESGRTTYVLLTIMFSLLLAGVIGIGSLYALHIGPFYPSLEVSK